MLVSASEFSNFSTVLVDLECGHGLNASSLLNLFVGIHINLSELHLWSLSSHCLKLRANHLARRAPAGREVNDKGLSTVFSGFNSSIESLEVSKVFCRLLDRLAESHTAS